MITEAARFFPSPGSSCKLPGKKMVAVGYGDGSGGAEDVGTSSCAVEESCAVVVASSVEATRSEENIFVFENVNSIMLRKMCCFAVYEWASTWFHSPSRQVRAGARWVACKRARGQGMEW